METIRINGAMGYKVEAGQLWVTKGGILMPDRVATGIECDLYEENVRLRSELTELKISAHAAHAELRKLAIFERLKCETCENWKKKDNAPMGHCHENGADWFPGEYCSSHQSCGKRTVEGLK